MHAHETPRLSESVLFLRLCAASERAPEHTDSYLRAKLDPHGSAQERPFRKPPRNPQVSRRSLTHPSRAAFLLLVVS